MLTLVGTHQLEIEGFLHREFGADNPSYEVFRASWESSKARLWMMNPDLFRAAAKECGGWSSDFASMVVRPIFARLHIRCTIRTPLTLPDGKTIYPAEGLLPARIVMEELAYCGKRQDEVESMGKEYSKRLYCQTEASIIGHSEMPSNSQAVNPNATEASLNFGVYREAVLTTFEG